MAALGAVADNNTGHFVPGIHQLCDLWQRDQARMDGSDKDREKNREHRAVPMAILMPRRPLNEFHFGTEHERADNSSVDFAVQVAVCSEMYDNLKKDVGTLETMVRQKLGGVQNIGDPDLGHRIRFLEDLADCQLDRKETGR